jgi:hypothetical protein
LREDTRRAAREAVGSLHVIARSPCDEAIQTPQRKDSGLLRYARNDGVCGGAGGYSTGSLVGWAKRLVRRSSKSEGGSVPTMSIAWARRCRAFAHATRPSARLTPPAKSSPRPRRSRCGSRCPGTSRA